MSHAPRHSSGHAPLDPRTAPMFPIAARALLGDTQLRKNVRHATDVIQNKRRIVVGEMPDWQELREAGTRVREHTMQHLDVYLERFEDNCTKAGGKVHWARDAAEARRIVVDLARAAGASEVIKIKSMTTEEIQLNSALEAAGIHPYETDLAELIIQLGQDQPSHIVVPALHKNRQQIREIFRREMNLPGLGNSPQDLADAARVFLRDKFLRVRTAVSGANFLIAETGGVCVVESEGNGRMCPDSARDPDHDCRDRQGGSAIRRPWRSAATAATVGDRRANESIQLDMDRDEPGARCAGRAAELPRGSSR